jgi:hypothetical protein
MAYHIDTNVNMSFGDIMDRLSILVLKIEKSSASESTLREFFYLSSKILFLRAGLARDCLSAFQDLFDVNSAIWCLEGDIRNCALDGDLIEVGRRAIKIRDKNKERVQIKNKLNMDTATGFPEFKVDHLSE